MHHIVKSKDGQFYAVLIASGNSEPLSSTENATRKEKVFKNIMSQNVATGNTYCLVQDDTAKGVPVYKVTQDVAYRDVNRMADPVYIPGKNPVKKKAAKKK